MTNEEIKKSFEDWFKSTDYYYGPGFELHKRAQLVAWEACSNFILDSAAKDFDAWEKLNIDKPFINTLEIWTQAKLSAFKDVKYANEQLVAKDREIERLKHELELGVQLINDAETSYRQAVKDLGWCLKAINYQSREDMKEYAKEIHSRHGIGEI